MNREEKMAARAERFARKIEASLAQAGNRARFEGSSFALARSGMRQWMAAVEEYGDAAAAGDFEAVAAIHEAADLAASLVEPVLPSGR